MSPTTALTVTELTGISEPDVLLGHYENGRLLEARQLMAQVLETTLYSNPRRATILGLYADVLVDLGDWDRADSALDEAYGLAETTNDAQARANVTWARAHTAAGRGDAVRAERLFREVERDATEWWNRYGVQFLCDAARTLDTLGLTAQAHDYLQRAHELLETSGVDPSRASEEAAPLRLARALILARSGDPASALGALGALARQGEPEPRLRWRFSLLSAWATLRAGDRDGAAVEAARAFAQATDLGGIGVAQAGEPEITAALAPLADEAGSTHAHRVMGAEADLLVRLFGPARVSDRDGVAIEVPAGKPGELVRMLALHPHGLAVEVVLEAFFPEAAPETSRHRLRQVLTRLRAAAGDIVVRDGEMLRLAPAWVDVREFRSLAQRTRASRGTRAVIFGQAARALTGRGPLLAADLEAAWAAEFRVEIAADLRQISDGA